ncbi:hypothetical protein [Pseudarthrobacter sp. NCCP-2145]|uniref:hypothetical protein n=1 Tax=Pseudarthrobacter sp. NCCP-2145 TaxID=2942290 RepID=UPI00204129F8|nr:hypothetical protein [Pseudarthrobacter sp. NCCP-2145]GKV74632.1 hypothetical protein NCCP2145_40130 [Pseudarthrobacter sp. NCCP-2145]
MRWDLGIAGLGLLAAMSLGFGLIAHWIVGKGLTRWLWLFAAIAYFPAGILVSEVWFGWASGEELQPNIDGLSFDEVQLVTLTGLIAALIVRNRIRRKPDSGEPAKKPSA